MSAKFLKKLFKERRSDVSLYIFSKIIALLLLSKIIHLLKGNKIKKNSCAIIFPPSLGLGDLIILSKIVDIIKLSKKFSYIKVVHFAPYLQHKKNNVEFLDITNFKKIINFETFIFPSPSLLNSYFAYILGFHKCKGYINGEIINMNGFEKENIKFNDPYYFRLEPFKKFFNFDGEITPDTWNIKEKKSLKFQKNYLEITRFSENIIKSEASFIIISTYNFYKKYRPPLKIILNEIRKKLTPEKNNILLLIGANAKKELKYNKELEFQFQNSLRNIKIINLTGKLSIENSRDLISQSNQYIGANNGLANVAQMLGIKCTLIFNGPEKSKKRNFSKSAEFISIN